MHSFLCDCAHMCLWVYVLMHIWVSLFRVHIYTNAIVCVCIHMRAFFVYLHMRLNFKPFTCMCAIYVSVNFCDTIWMCLWGCAFVHLFIYALLFISSMCIGMCIWKFVCACLQIHLVTCIWAYVWLWIHECACICKCVHVCL